MSKVKSISPYVVIGIGLAGASYLSSKNNRDQLVQVSRKVMEKVKVIYTGRSSGACDELIEKAGNPDPHDIEDTKMVSEGAMYAVEYYNQEEQQ
ncbi:hypothetical protein [Lederbergia graminis]|uniref:Uncharacterized protein n=1 Tax=Lederbergia graminis TaxID=735518 RepID=A0ABW0LI43_9BACI|nr:hypothetical protein [Paenibacillus bovis]HLU22678.1 hypothetical protein [Bacillaceae bacterium]